VEQNVARRRNVVTSLIPEIRQAQQREMQQEDKDEDGSENKGRIVVRISPSTITVSRQIAQSFPRKRNRETGRQTSDLSRQTSDAGHETQRKVLSEVRSPRSKI